ncbi:class I SAM-dependent methyltransferase [Streptomyces sp. MST-110588]|uniref:class I SAM-dependent methyltransferase n=1 Tax=Streptomyces sp. MST-110588 TaxID=2833628 RepID=UPI001F5DEC4E|nr:class I SAM-dependent methyltransferase [Streptomyces sp. MST-110588]UNO38453.1 class I SAM-dependent methyltransferase [Streptomyces sp. MST-110588]
MPARPDGRDTVRVLDVRSADYRRAFELLLAGTDEKAVTHARLSALVARLPARSVFVDIGAGAGDTTAHVGRSFARTVAVEPNASLREALRRACPEAEILPRPVESVELPAGSADLVLCCHVLYYLPRATWAATVRRMLGWLRPGGEIWILLQNADNACLRMVRHFTGAHFDLAPLAAELREGRDGPVAACSLERLPCAYRTARLDDAVDVAEFMLNVPSLARQDPLPALQELCDYVRRECADPAGGYRIDHSQDLLRVRRA